MTTETPVQSPETALPVAILDQPQFQSPDPSPRRSPSQSRSRSPRQSRNPRRTPSRSRSRTRIDPIPPSPPASGPPDAAFYADAPASSAEPETVGVREALRDIADAGAHGAGKKRDANQQDWEEFLQALFGFASMLLVLFLVVGRGMAKAERREFELTDEEAEALAAPAGRILARSWINAKWGKHILGGADWIVMALTLTDYTERVSPLIRERMRTLAPRPGTTARRGRPAPTPTPPTEENNGFVAGPAQQEQWHPYAGIRGSQFT